MTQTKRFKPRVSDDLYEVEVHVSGLQVQCFMNKYRKGGTRKFKGDLAVQFQIFSDKCLSVWKSDFSELFFSIEDDSVLVEVIRRYKFLFPGVLFGLKENGNWDYDITIVLFLPKLPKKYIIAEEPKKKKAVTSQKKTISTKANKRLEVRIPVSENLANFLKDEVEYYSQEAKERHFYLSASFVDINKVIVSDLETDDFLLSLFDKELHDYLEVFGKVEAFLDDYEIESGDIICHFEILNPKVKPLSFRKLLSEEGRGILACSDLRVAVLFKNMRGEERLVDITKGDINTIVVGSDYIPDYKDFWINIHEEDWVILKREPTNPINKDAIAVYWRDKKIGYIPNDDLPIVSLVMPNTTKPASVKENNLGWISININITADVLMFDDRNEKFGPFNYKIMKNNQVVRINKEQLDKLFIF